MFYRYKIPTVLLCSIFFFLVLASAVHGEKIVSGTININTATIKELKLLPGVGIKTAEKIIRSRKGSDFESVGELRSRKLVGVKTFGKISQFITVQGESDFKTNAKILQKKPRKQSGSTKAKPEQSGDDENVLESLKKYQGEIYWLPDGAFYKLLMDKVAEAEESIILSTFVFKISNSPRNAAVRLVGKLQEAVARNVDVNVVMEASGYSASLNKDNNITAQSLKSKGIAVRFDTKKRITHAKLVVIDSRWVFIGSHNLTHSALLLSKETSIMFDSPKFATTVTEYISTIK